MDLGRQWAQARKWFLKLKGSCLCGSCNRTNLKPARTAIFVLCLSLLLVVPQRSVDRDKVNFCFLTLLLSTPCGFFFVFAFHSKSPFSLLFLSCLPSGQLSAGGLSLHRTTASPADVGFECLNHKTWSKRVHLTVLPACRIQIMTGT